jgi:MFS family permease
VTTQHHSWRTVAAAMFVIGWGGNQFTPLLGVYKDLGGYSQLDVDVFLGAYVFGLIPGLLIAAALSDRYGRRPVLLAGLWSSLTGTLLLSLGVHGGYPGLVGGRMLSGVAVGVAMSVGSSWVSELSRDARPGAGARRSALWLTAGLGCGPASAGLLAHFATPALTWPFAVHAALCVPAIIAVSAARSAETRLPVDTRIPLRIGASGVRDRRFRRVVLPMAPWVFGSAGIAYAIVPSQVEGGLGDWALLFTAAITVATLGTGVLVQPLARRLDRPGSSRAIVVSMVLMTVGVWLAALTAATGSPWLAAPVAVALGGAYGIAVVSGLLEVQRIAAPEELARLTGIYYALTYVGFLLPAVLAAFAHWFSYPVMLAVLALVAACCTLACRAGGAQVSSSSGTGNSNARSKAATLASSSRPVLVICGSPKLPNRSLGLSIANCAAPSESVKIATRSGA